MICYNIVGDKFEKTRHGEGYYIVVMYSTQATVLRYDFFLRYILGLFSYVVIAWNHKLVEHFFGRIINNIETIKFKTEEEVEIFMDKLNAHFVAEKLSIC